MVVPSDTQRLQLFRSSLLNLAQTNFAPPTKLLMPDLVTKHDIVVNEKLACRCDFCFGAAASAANLRIELSGLSITTRLVCYGMRCAF